MPLPTTTTTKWTASQPQISLTIVGRVGPGTDVGGRRSAGSQTLGQPTRVFLRLIDDEVEMNVQSLLTLLFHARLLLELDHLGGERMGMNEKNEWE